VTVRSVIAPRQYQGIGSRKRRQTPPWVLVPKVKPRSKSVGAVEVCAGASGFDHVLNGRFRGGWITRHYGRPDDGVHAIQMELPQSAYMREAPPWDYLEGSAAKVRPVLRRALGAMLEAGVRLNGEKR
jgi:N-formylglutamate amidohydrolase